MNKSLLLAIAGIIGMLLVIGGIKVWYQGGNVSSSVVKENKVENSSSFEETIKQIDLKTQPEWVQNLKVTGKKGRSPNGLENFTLSVSGIPSSVESLTYVVQYQTANKGMQGALGMTPQRVINGQFTKTIDFGTCSAKSCVYHEGVTSVDIELNFSDSSVWTGHIDLK